MGMKVPCESIFHGQNQFLNVLRADLIQYTLFLIRKLGLHLQINFLKNLMIFTSKTFLWLFLIQCEILTVRNFGVKCIKFYFPITVWILSIKALLNTFTLKTIWNYPDKPRYGQEKVNLTASFLKTFWCTFLAFNTVQIKLS